MNDIQSLSISVPNDKCINKCKFCCACMVKEDYENLIMSRSGDYKTHFDNYLKRMKFARDNGCNTVMLTGNSEPQQNYEFLRMFGIMNRMLDSPFQIIEIQTTGVLLDEKYLKFLRDFVGVTTISISLSSFDDRINTDYNGTDPKIAIKLADLFYDIKKLGFTLRLSINLTDAFNEWSPDRLFKYCKRMKADQLTFRLLYESDSKKTIKDFWIQEHRAKDKVLDDIKWYIKSEGHELETLPSGAQKYSVKEMSTIVDTDCMSKEQNDTFRYLILREDCKLYSKWDDKGSLIF